MPLHSYNYRGFSLLEMMVSIAIMLTIITLVVTSQSTYTKGASLRNLANDISLYLRQAQVYGISVKELGIGTSDFSNAYGIEFRRTSAGGADNAYIFFADIDKNGFYSSPWACATGAAPECLEKRATSSGNTISQLCLVFNNNTTDCTLGRADVSFLRPNTTANIVYFNSSGSQIAASTNHKGLQITLMASAGGTRSVTIYKTGQISVR
jgi:prepilin-type N-terminal cleavage/methylation domain-containing protein